jgi:antitoxin ParD1/3/4
MGININLTPQLEEMVRQKVTSGMYSSASEVVREALRLMDEKDQLRAAKLSQLQQEIQEGLNSGPAIAWDADEVKRAGRARRAAKVSGAIQMPSPNDFHRCATILRFAINSSLPQRHDIPSCSWQGSLTGGNNEKIDRVICRNRAGRKRLGLRRSPHERRGGRHENDGHQ